MASSNVIAGILWARAFIDSDATTPVYFHQEGFAGGTAITRSAAGTYVLTLSQGVDNTEAYLFVNLRGAASGLITAAMTTDTTITTISWTATIASPAVTALGDLDYNIQVQRKMS